MQICFFLVYAVYVDVKIASHIGLCRFVFQANIPFSMDQIGRQNVFCVITEQQHLHRCYNSGRAE
jgi:hypothetical protein